MGQQVGSVCRRGPARAAAASYTPSPPPAAAAAAASHLIHGRRRVPHRRPSQEPVGGFLPYGPEKGPARSHAQARGSRRAVLWLSAALCLGINLPSKTSRRRHARTGAGGPGGVSLPGPPRDAVTVLHHGAETNAPGRARGD